MVAACAIRARRDARDRSSCLRAAELCRLGSAFQQEGIGFGAIKQDGHWRIAKVPVFAGDSEPDCKVETGLAAIELRRSSLSTEIETSRTSCATYSLPELLSGRIRVPEADEAVEEAVA